MEPASAASRARMGELPETVRFKNRFALAITTTTPLEAMVEDLLFIRDILDAAGIEYLLVRGNDERPVIAVSWTERKNLRQALVEGCANAPFYSKTVDAKKSPALLVADGALSKTNKSRIFRLFRPRVHVASGMNYGANIGVQIELWSISDEEIVLPVENSLTRRTVLPKKRSEEPSSDSAGSGRPSRTCSPIMPPISASISILSFLGRRLFQRVSGSARQADAELHRRRGGRIRGAFPSDRRAQVRATVHPHVRAVDPTDLRRNRFRSSGLACGRSASHVHAQRKVLRRSKCVAHP